jgi:transcription elongation factor/antiterminator RfaH
MAESWPSLGGDFCAGWHFWAFFGQSSFLVFYDPSVIGAPSERRLSLKNGVALDSGAFCLPQSQQERWYVARTLPQRELQAAKQLANQDFRAFVPRYWKNRRHARRVETISAPLFPRYIFVILDRSRDRWRSINGTLGVERLLIQGGEPRPVPHGVVESLVDCADAEGNIQFHYELKEGQSLKVTAGPFADLVGTLERLDDRGRVSVLLELMGGPVRVTLPQTLVAPG